ncbi:hypothetical protein IMZ48_00675, partial [Candidatus Bathyarchaeota archaeon]|nr:hypothetical protein [Candidatus Bathyarchaeota archaeon]
METPTVDSEALGAGAAAAAAASGTRRQPSVRRRKKSPAGLPRIDTDMYGPRGADSKHGRSQSSAPAYDPDYRYNPPRSPERPSRHAQDVFLSPEVIKAGRNREESSHYGSSRGPRMSRQGERPSSSSNRRRDEAHYNTGYLETPGTGSRTRLEPDLRSVRGSRRSSPRPPEEAIIVEDAGLEDRSAFYPDLSRP